jgi:hypothetical protein
VHPIRGDWSVRAYHQSGWLFVPNDERKRGGGERERERKRRGGGGGEREREKEERTVPVAAATSSGWYAASHAAAFDPPHWPAMTTCRARQCKQCKCYAVILLATTALTYYDGNMQNKTM